MSNKLSIVEAVRKGWAYIHDNPNEPLPSQCFYIQAVNLRLCAVEGNARFEVQQTAFARAALDEEYSQEWINIYTTCNNGVYVTKRVAARLSVWAHCSPEDIDTDGSAKDVRVAFEQCTQEYAYAQELCNESCECDTIDGYRFAPTSCMEGEGVNAFDANGDLYNCWVFSFEDEARVARVNVWTTPAGDFCEVIFGCPARHAQKVIDILKQHNVKPLDEYPYITENCVIMTVTCNGIIGYCDYVGRTPGQRGTEYTLFSLFRHSECRKTTDVAEATYSYLCEQCHAWHGGERKEEPFEDEYFGLLGYFIDGHYYCNRYCAQRNGYIECEYCGEWLKKDDAVEIAGEHFFHRACAALETETGKIKPCAHCGELILVKDAMRTFDRTVFDSITCANKAGYFMFIPTKSMFYTAEQIRTVRKQCLETGDKHTAAVIDHTLALYGFDNSNDQNVTPHTETPLKLPTLTFHANIDGTGHWELTREADAELEREGIAVDNERVRGETPHTDTGAALNSLPSDEVDQYLGGIPADETREEVAQALATR